MTSLALRLSRLTFVGLGGVLLAQACGASSDGSSGLALGGFTSSLGGGGVSVIMPDAGPSMNEGGASTVSPLCGISANGCDPDHPRVCSAPTSKFELSAGGQGGAGGASGAGGAGGASGESGTGNNGGAGGESGAGRGPGPKAGGGSEGNAGAGGSTSGASDGGSGGAHAPDYACRVTFVANGPAAVCASSGDGGLDAPCFTGSDCAPGLACARYRNVARCRPYCCHGDDSCAPGTYCTEQALVDDSIPIANSSMLVPVCAPADGCDLEEPYPCPAGRTCQCPSGKACLVVRTDGTTTCETPGTGELGGACPCNHGFVCSRATGVGVCQQLCATSSQSTLDPCAKGGRCQSSSELPTGFGVCVGG